MTEDQLQAECFRFCWNAHPETRKLLFSVPNGGLRSPREAQKLKSTGTVAGVSDLIFLWKGKCYLIEMKTGTGTQQKNQKEWELLVKSHGFEYFICRSLEQFKLIINKIIG
jgi:hypothetical protein